MLAIRLQRTGRKGHAMFRVVVQESRVSPSSGRVVAQLGSYDPHAKTVALDKEKASFYLEHGAQPSDRVVTLFSNEGITIPKWVKTASTKPRSVRNPDKLRRNQPKAEVVAEEAPAETEAAEPVAEASAEQAEAPTEESAEA